MKPQNQDCPVIVAAAHAAPPNDIPQAFVRAAVAQQFAGKIDDLEKILAIFDHSRITRRQFVRPPDWYVHPHTWAERNQIYQHDGLELMVRAAQSCLASAGCTPQDVDQIVFVSSTGFATMERWFRNNAKPEPGYGLLSAFGPGFSAELALLEV